MHIIIILNTTNNYSDYSAAYTVVRPVNVPAFLSAPVSIVWIFRRTGATSSWRRSWCLPLRRRKDSDRSEMLTHTHTNLTERTDHDSMIRHTGALWDNGGFCTHLSLGIHFYIPRETKRALCKRVRYVTLMFLHVINPSRLLKYGELSSTTPGERPERSYWFTRALWMCVFMFATLWRVSSSCLFSSLSSKTTGLLKCSTLKQQERQSRTWSLVARMTKIFIQTVKKCPFSSQNQNQKLRKSILHWNWGPFRYFALWLWYIINIFYFIYKYNKKYLFFFFLIYISWFCGEIWPWHF